MRIIKAPPPDLATLLIDLGPRRLVLLEGDSDLAAFNEWFLEREADVYFHVAPGGNEGVKALLQEARAISSTQRVYGIIDRDFRPDAEVEACLNDPNTHLFILRRYCLENYLLEPDVLREQLRLYYGAEFVVPDVNAIRSGLLKMCRQLGVLMATNWMLLDDAGVFLPPEFDVEDRNALVQRAATHLAISVSEAEGRIAAKEALLTPKLTTLEDAHTCINGKSLYHKMYQKYILDVRRGFLKSHLLNLLVSTVKVHGIHADIKAIVEDRILK